MGWEGPNSRVDDTFWESWRAFAQIGPARSGFRLETLAELRSRRLKQPQMRSESKLTLQGKVTLNPG
uniref:Uncharacterized protein n=1 Tax=Chlorocebus sabaeus TaxID=60711 RepID=A0A0D9RN67_CHLSB